ncbi:MAG TPA: SRPBCC domain-containing protein [Methanomassiliicoccales archaeon]
MGDPDGIQWPEHFDPRNAPVHVRNELVVKAPCDSVWGWLVRAELWPTWYTNSKDVRFLEGSPPDLQLGTRFAWKTFGLDLVSTVVEFETGKRLAWDAKGRGVSAYHAWLLQGTDMGCKVVTEETHYGWLARLNNRFRPDNMQMRHQEWLEGLADKARKGRP